MPFVVAVLIVLADQFSKALVVRNVPLFNEPIPLALGFHLTHTRNTGAAFGLLHGWSLGPITGTTLLAIFSLLASGYIAYLIVRYGRAFNPLIRVALGLILGGAIGNVIDRFLLGYVTDFIHFKVGTFEFAIFNVADSAVVIGAIVAFVATLFIPEKK